MVNENKKIKIIHFTIANTGGGITKFVLRLWKYIDKERFQFDFVTMNSHLDFAEELEKEGCKIYYLSVYAEQDKERFAKEVKEILSKGYDVVHLHTTWWRGFILEDIAREMQVPKVIVHAHNADVHVKDPQMLEAARKLHNEQKRYLTEDIATDFYACSSKAAEWLYGDYISEEKIKIVPNAIELNQFVYDDSIRQEYRRKFEVENSYVIGHVGRFSHEKNHIFLIDIFTEVTKVNVDAKLLLIGVGELENDVRELVEKKGLTERVIFAGKREDVNCIMQAMDLLVLPSLFEGLGVVLIEAQAAGLKCLASTEVPEDVELTENIRRIPLDKAKWVEEIVNAYPYERTNKQLKKIRNAGYDIMSMVRNMEQDYQ